MQQELDELIIESEAAGETLEIIEISGTVIEGGLIIAAG
jgi:hypothetical protein